MRRAGRVVGSAQGVAVLRAPEDAPPEMGTPVVDERLERVGKVVDIFGPVSRPYLAVAPAADVRPDHLLNQVLYIR